MNDFQKFMTFAKRNGLMRLPVKEVAYVYRALNKEHKNN